MLLPEVTVAVLLTVPVVGQVPPVAAVVGEVTTTVNVLFTSLVLAATVTPFVPPQLSVCCAGAVPEIKQLVPQPLPTPLVAIDQFKPAIIGSGSLNVVFLESPPPVLNTVTVNEIGSPALTVDGLPAVLSIWMFGELTQSLALSI